MSDILTLGLAWIAGGALGALFFGGLWWTVRRGMASPRPVLWFFGGLLLRMASAMGGFYFVAAGQWQRLMACLLGFVMARLLVTWLARPPHGPPGSNRSGMPEEASHAP